MFSAGDEIKEDDAEGLKWLRNAADQGHPRAQYYLGCMFALGWGIKQDYGEGKHNWTTTIRRVIPVGNEVRATGYWSCNVKGSGFDQGTCSWVLVHCYIDC
jgi:hypothetical protein